MFKDFQCIRIFFDFRQRSGVNSQDESEKKLNNYFGIIDYIV